MSVRNANRARLSLESFEDRVVPAVTGNVWYDLNADGVKGTGEWGAEGGIPVSLYQGGVWVASTTTNSSGNYSFSQTATGADAVEVSPYYVYTPYTFSTPVDGSGRGVVTAGVGNVGLVGHGWELGGLGTIYGTVWLDADADGVRDAGEATYDDLVVELYYGSTLLGSNYMTDGEPLFGPLCLWDGSYTLRVADLSGYAITTPLNGNGEIEVEISGSNTATVGIGLATQVTVAKVDDAAEGGGNGTFRFTRTGDVSSSLAVNYTVSGTATPGTDYTALTGTVTFAANSSTADVTVAVINDNDPEYDEDVEVGITDGDGYVAGSVDAAGLLIIDNETPVASVVRLYDSLEGGWQGMFAFRRTGDTSTGLTVNYSVGGSATSGTDFTALPGTVTFAPGQAVVFVEVEALADGVADADETVSATIQTGTGYNIHSSDNSASILISESAPLVWIDSSPTSVAEGTSSQIILKRSGGDLSQELAVAVYIGGGSGSAPLWSYDYYVEGRLSLWSGWGQVTFAANEDTVTLTLFAREDNEAEGDEEFLVELGAGDGTSYVLGTVSSVTGVITNVVPSGTVPILADESLPLNSAQAGQLARHLQRAAGNGKPLSAVEKIEMEQWMRRLANYGLEAEGENRLNQLKLILEGLGNAIRGNAVGQAAALYAAFTDAIINEAKVARENEYKKFKQLMGGLDGAKAKERYDEIKDGFAAAWVNFHWVRYNAENLKSKLPAM